MPASMRKTPAGVRTAVQFPEEPLANMQSWIDIRVRRLKGQINYMVQHKMRKGNRRVAEEDEAG